MLIKGDGSKRIGIDVRMAHCTGIGRYIRGTVSALHNVHWKYILFGPHRHREDFPVQMSFINTDIPIYGFREQIGIPLLARECDCLHIPHYNAPLFWKKKLIITIHDLIHLHFPDHLTSPLARLYSSTLLPLILRRADQIIAVSKFTKDDLIKTLRIDARKITVIHHGVDPRFNINLATKKNNGSEKEKYLLYVGLIKQHKNVGILIESFLRLKKRTGFENLKLRLVGKSDMKQKIVREWIYEINRNDDILLEPQVDEQRLIDLYHNAAVLVFPSLYEGFGFPLLEAMASRIPIVASRAASIPEILGEGAGLYFDPHSASELEQCLLKILQSSYLASRLIEDGSKRLKQFQWDKSAKMTEEVYESVLGSN